MGKTRSTIFLILLTIVIVVMCAVCTLSFQIPGTVNNFNSVISIMNKDAQFGSGATVVYYPEGVISQEEYETTVASYTDNTERAKYEEKYTAYADGTLYLETEKCFEDGEVSEEFKTNFANDVQALKERFEAYSVSSVRFEIYDDFTVRVTVPATSGTSALQYFGYMGDFNVAVSEPNNKIIENTRKESVNDYVRGIYATTVQDNAYVVIDFTAKGRETIKEATEGGSKTLYFMIGENSILPLSASEQIDQDSLFISGSTITNATAGAIAIALNQALNGTKTELALETANVMIYENTFGELAPLFAYLTVAIFMVVTFVAFFVRYHALAVSHVYGYLTFLICMTLCLTFIPFIGLSVGSVVAVALTSVLLAVSNVVMFEEVKKLVESPKAFKTALSNGYKKALWKIVDAHVALALVAFVAYFIAVAEFQAFAFVLGLGVVFSCACSLLVTRFTWAITMAYKTSDRERAKFCNFEYRTARKEVK